MMNTAHKIKPYEPSTTPKPIEPELIYPEQNLWFLKDYDEFPQIPTNEIGKCYNVKDNIQQMLYDVAKDPVTTEECQKLIYELLTKYDDLRAPLIRGIHKSFKFNKPRKPSLSDIEFEEKLRRTKEEAVETQEDTRQHIVSMIFIAFCVIAFYALSLFSHNG